MAMDPAPWTLLPGDSEATRELAGLLGVKYRQEPQGGFVHSNLVTVLNRHVGLQQSVADTMTGIRRVAQE
jgi:protein SCO1/2